MLTFTFEKSMKFYKILLNNKKLIVFGTLIGVLVGAIIGNTLLLKFKSEGVLNVEMTVPEFKKFFEAASNQPTLKNYLLINPLSEDANELLIKQVANDKWLTALPKLSKVEAKDLPEPLQKIALESETPKSERTEKMIGFEKIEKTRNDSSDSSANKNKAGIVYVGTRITATSPNADMAAQMSNWLGNYFKEVASKEALREQVSQWNANYLSFTERAKEERFKLMFDIEQAELRTISLQKLVNQYPALLKTPLQEAVDVRTDNEKFISPAVQLLGAQSEIISIREKLNRLTREQTQNNYASIFLSKIQLQANISSTSNIKNITQILNTELNNSKNPAEQEKILSYSNDISKINTRFLSQAQFIVPPAIPERPEQPRPLMITALFGFFAFILALLWSFREVLINTFKNDAVESD